MASTFTLKKYLSKFYAHQLLTELGERHSAQMFFEIGEETPRKLAITLMEDSIKSLAAEVRIEVMKDLSYTFSMTNAHTARLARKLFKESTGKDFEPEIEMEGDADIMLYMFLRHQELADKLAFLSPFYASKSYISYEAKRIEKVGVESKLTELSREFTRLANKDDNATEQEMEHIFLDGIWHIESKFQGGYDVQQRVDAATGEIDTKHTVRKIQTIRIAYLPEEEVILIGGNISKEEKMVFMDTFLRVVCGVGYEGKVESYDMQPLKNLALDFSQYNKGTPFIKAVIKSATLSYADGKKKLRITLPSSREHAGLQALKEMLDELQLIERFASSTIVNMTFGFMFQNKDALDKGVQVSCSITPMKASLCPLFEYERYTKSILKNAGVYEGWKVKEEK